jgi:hypothetical protein
LLEIGRDGGIRARHAAPAGALDGITLYGERFLITSWDASAVFVATRDGQFEYERKGVESPADLGFDRKRRRLLLPLMNAGEILVDSLAGE